MQLHQDIGRALARGDWRADAYAPLLVSDPVEARRLLWPDRASPPPPAWRHDRQCLEHGILPYSVFMQALPRLDFGQRARLERLCSDPRLLWSDVWKNIVVNQGLNDLLNITLRGDTQDNTWFVGLTAGSPTVAAGDTLASHAGWTEVTVYDEAARVGWTPGATTTTMSLSNTASPAVFTISANGTTIGGAFLAGDGTKGGTSGRLYAAGAFSAGNKVLDDNDTLTVTITATTAAS
jgi:hypothetical protein